MNGIAIGIPTFQRPEGLKRLLQSLARLRFDTIQTPELCVIVVDNDPSGSAGAVVETARADLPWPVYHAVEPRPGIAHARNRIVALAGEKAMDFIAFIDDDEEADPEWLEQLLRVQTLCNASLVSGPVLPVYAPGTAEWVIQSGFFQEKQFAEGTTPKWGCTCNLLIDRRMLALMAGPFEPRLGLTGGEDSHLFERIRRLPEWKWVWAPKAVVREHVPRQRATLTWMLKRQYRWGNGRTFVNRYLDGPDSWRLCMIAEALVALAAWAILSLPLLYQGRRGLVRSAGHLFRAAGILTGLLGIPFHAYGKDKNRAEEPPA